jgi:actin-like ATPase involved in cell morphogenesis
VYIKASSSAKEVEVETIIADDPLTCVVRGLGRIIDNFDRRQELLDGQLKAPTISL